MKDDGALADAGFFDRDYSLKELLPRAWLEDLHRVIGTALPQKLAVLEPEGNIHFAAGQWCDQVLIRISAFVMQKMPETETQPVLSSENAVLLIPLVHELETKGYLATAETNGDALLKTGWGRAAGYVLQQMMKWQHQTLLMSNLHGTVVVESYTGLKEKADQLAISEKKYRKLSDSLETQVQRKTEEIRLAQAHMMHHEKLASIGQLSAGMAHEINNPLGAIISNLNTLSGYGVEITGIAAQYNALLSVLMEPVTGRTANIVAEFVRKIAAIKQKLDFDFLMSDLNELIKETIAGAEKIHKIVSDLKTVARPGIKREEWIDVNESIKAVLTIIGNRIGDSIQVDTIFRPMPAVYAHAQNLNHVWLSLLLNALDAMDGKGIITIETQHHGNQISVCMSDTGCGIASEHLSKIFDPFFTTRDVGKGTGLGLHLVYHLINELNGNIEVESNVGTGTSFCICLPVAESM